MTPTPLLGLDPLWLDLERRYLFLFHAREVERYTVREPAQRQPAKPKISRQARAVVCVETNESYPSLADAARAVGIYPSSLGHALKHRHGAGGYHWRYADDLKPFVPARSRERAVRCVETGTVYPSVRAAKVAVGITHHSRIVRAIERACRCEGFHWEYVDGGQEGVAA